MVYGLIKRTEEEDDSWDREQLEKLKVDIQCSSCEVCSDQGPGASTSVLAGVLSAVEPIAAESQICPSDFSVIENCVGDYGSFEFVLKLLRQYAYEMLQRVEVQLSCCHVDVFRLDTLHGSLEEARQLLEDWQDDHPRLIYVFESLFNVKKILFPDPKKSKEVEKSTVEYTLLEATRVVRDAFVLQYMYVEWNVTSSQFGIDMKTLYESFFPGKVLDGVKTSQLSLSMRNITQLGQLPYHEFKKWAKESTFKECSWDEVEWAQVYNVHGGSGQSSSLTHFLNIVRDIEVRYTRHAGPSLKQAI